MQLNTIYIQLFKTVSLSILTIRLVVLAFEIGEIP